MVIIYWYHCITIEVYIYTFEIAFKSRLVMKPFTHFSL